MIPKSNKKGSKNLISLTSNDQNQLSFEKQVISRQNFTEQEDQIILYFCDEMGIKNWKLISKYLPLRNVKSCRDRYFNYLNPDLSQNEWSKEEDEFLFELIQAYGKQWIKISEVMKNRSANMIKIDGIDI
jgi:hypothetical protein